MKGFRTRLVQTGHFAKQLNYFELKAIETCGLMRHFYVSLRGFEFGAFLIIRGITGNNVW